MTISARAIRRRGATAFGFATTAAAVLLMIGSSAGVALTSTVPLGTSAQYAVLGASTVTNTGNSVLNGSLGLSPGTSITGFPPGKVVPPGTINKTNAAAAQARADLTAAYINAAGRPIDATTPADLANQHLQAGVYSGPSKGALSLTGPLVLDGAGNANSVFIFQTNSSLITATSSTVSLINGAQECNVFWQVGSSATLNSGSVFVGNILALTSISVKNAVVVHGRALARNGAVTLINDVFTRPTCATGTTTTTTPSTPTTTPGSATTTPGSGLQGGTPPTAAPGTPGAGSGGGNGTPGVGGPPRTDAVPVNTGSFPWSAVLFGGLLASAGTASAIVGRRRMQLHTVAPRAGTRRP
jgi:hypothetical protein